MSSPDDLEFLVRLLVATSCGAVIGAERQYRARTAGLRTQALVAAAAASFVLVGEQSGATTAPLQITAYVVSGVGFLGGGAILRQGLSVQGLNTAATLWCSAAVGCQAATGHLVPALTVTAVVLGIHLLLRPIGRLIDRAPTAGDDAPAEYLVVIEARRKHEPQVRALLLQALQTEGIILRGLARAVDDESGVATLHAQILLDGPARTHLDALTTRMSLEAGVLSLSWSAEDPEDQDPDGGPLERRRMLGRLGRVHRTRPADPA